MVNKLKDFPHSYVITMPDAWDARKRITKQFQELEYSNYSFVPGIMSETAKDRLLGKTYNFGMPDLQSTDKQLAIMMAHLKTISYWLEHTADEFAIIMEDDISTELVDFWKFSWSDFFAKLPSDIDILQLCILKVEAHEYSKIKFEHRVRRSDYASAACYLISRKYGEELLRRHVIGNKFNLMPISSGINSVADEILYDTDNAYACPLFIFNDNSLDGRMSVSDLHHEAYGRMIYLWENHAPQTLEELFEN